MCCGIFVSSQKIGLISLDIMFLQFRRVDRCRPRTVLSQFHLMDRQRYCSATQQVPYCDRQQATVDQKQRQAMSTGTTITSVGEVREARFSESRESRESREPSRPTIIGSGDECRRLASPLIAVLLASVSERRDGDDAQSILEDHLLRVWDETVSTGFTPDKFAADSINNDTDITKWSTNDTREQG